MNNEKPHRIASTVARLITARPLVSLLVSVVAAFVLFNGASLLKQDYSYRSWFYDDDPILTTFDAFEREFGNDDTVLVAVHSPSGIFDADSASLVRRATEALWKAPRVMRVDSLSNFQWVHAEGDEIVVEDLLPAYGELTPTLLEERRDVALSHEVLPHYLVSPDGTTALISVRLEPLLNSEHIPDYKEVVAGVQEVVASLEGRGDNELFINGFPVVTDQFRASAEADIVGLVPIVFLVLALSFLLIFRTIGAALFPMLTVIIAVLSTLGIAGALGLEINNITAVIPHIILAIGVADSVHIVTTFYHGRRGGLDRREATRRSLEHNFLPTIATSVTTTVGFLSFSFSSVPPVSGLGAIAAIGCVMAWVFSYTFLGATLVLVPSRVPRNPVLTDELDKSSAVATRFTAWVDRHRRTILISGGGACVLALGIASSLQVNSDSFEYFDKSLPIRKSTALLEDKMGAAVAVELVVRGDGPNSVQDPAFLTKVDEFQHLLAKKEYITKVFSLVDTFKATHRALHGDSPDAYRLPTTAEEVGQLLFLYELSLPQGRDLSDRISIGRDALRLTLMWSERRSAKTIEAIKDVEELAREVGLDVTVTGKFPLSAALNPRIVSTFFTSILTALFVISGLLMLFLRSAPLGGLAMIPNILPLIIGIGSLRFIGKYIDAGTAVMGSVVIGVAVDDTIHFLSNYRRVAASGSSPTEAVARVLTATGPALIFTTAILCVGFGVFSFSDYTPNRNFGVLVALTLTYALVADLVLLPALLLGQEPSAKKA